MPRTIGDMRVGNHQDGREGKYTTPDFRMIILEGCAHIAASLPGTPGFARESRQRHSGMDSRFV